MGSDALIDLVVPPESSTFPFAATEERLANLIASGHDFRPHSDGRAFVSSSGVRFEPPLLLAPAGRTIAQYRLDLDEQPDAPDHLVILVQAGACALGLWRGLQRERTKVFRRYVVRGKGRAQPLHAKTRGKSRYGSRLRLQNHRLLLTEINEKLLEWSAEGALPKRIFASVPVRTWAELLAARPPIPFTQRDVISIPFHVHAPNLEELLKVQARLTRGVVRSESESPPADEGAPAPGH